MSNGVRESIYSAGVREFQEEFGLTDPSDLLLTFRMIKEMRERGTLPNKYLPLAVYLRRFMEELVHGHRFVQDAG